MIELLKMYNRCLCRENVATF